MSLKARLVAEIAADGPIDMAAFMTRCLHDPLDGYYATRPALGEAGDFITAPLVSQMFGELIGLWLVETWHGLGAPPRVILAEVGPGDGTLMADALRAARLGPAFLAAASLWLVESSAPLRDLQAARLAAAGANWAAALAELPTDAPLLLVANEFLDCLPTRQFQRTPGGWAERVVGVDADGALCFGLRPAAVRLPDAPTGAVLERSPAQAAFAAELAGRLAGQGGAALLIDYGRAIPGCGDTLQALARHRKVDPLNEPGAADVTVHADFPAVLAAAGAANVSTGLLTQGEFLRRLGVEARAAALAKARPDQAATIARQLSRLIADDQMGELFKAAALWSGPAPPPAFEPAA
ncbi:MAG TPA: SAM-dependent methyltransferase [Caulobacteraceae bacterium]|jgi:SAM-dependent MidA family methyltransferase|nr:SAM-dependent methyltransferase [Caulobacteraceae bacterium]